MENFKQKLTKIKTFIFDVDGVLTDGKVFVFENGDVVRNMNSKDGYAIHLAVKKNYRIVIISGGNNVAIKNMLIKAGVIDIFINQHDKLQCYKDFIAENGLSEEEILYMGDDLPDWEVMSRVGLAVCPNDAATEIKALSLYISNNKGGEGCVRDIIEQVLRVQNNWEISNW
ncbi:MAG: HAD hydrolase family protein [Bacteroidetes bacterium]|nr:HAD hydrolase family protein [Bacteroidota bacterium]MCA6442298.1 HAD hydrolase family protein [Bacteroidota bacterium]